MKMNRVKFEDIKPGLEAFRVTVGIIERVTFTSEPYMYDGSCTILAGEYKVNINKTFDQSVFLSDYSIHKGQDGSVLKDGETNSFFIDEESAKEYVELTKDSVKAHFDSIETDYMDRYIYEL